MKFSILDLQCTDIMWFGVDANGNIFECTSAGCGNVPEYVCRSKEETRLLETYFLEKAPIITDGELLIPRKKNTLVNDALSLISKGVYCYDVTDYDHDDIYGCIAVPHRSLKITELPEDIQQILSDHIYNGNVEEEREISVSHAY